MLRDRPVQAGARAALVVSQAVGLALLAVFLIFLFSGGKGQLFLGAIVALIGAVWVVQQPHWGVLILLVVFFSGVSPSLLGIRYLGVPYLLSALLVVPLALSVLHHREVWVWRVPQIKILAAVGLLFLVSVLWNDLTYTGVIIPGGDDTEREVELFVSRLAFLVFFLYFVTTQQTIAFVVWIVLGLICLSASNALLSFIASGGADRAASDFSLATNSNRLAFICLFATSLLWFYRVHGQEQWLKTLVLPLLLFLPVTALTAGSRSGLLQMAVLAGFILKEQKGWSAAKRISSLFVVGFVVTLMLIVVPSTQLQRVTSFDPEEAAPGQASLQNRFQVVYVALLTVASYPLLGVGLGDFPWKSRALFGSGGNTHNSYLWALVSGGVGALALYLLLFFFTYRMLRQLERWGPRELLWVSKGLKVNLILFLLFSLTADMWLNNFLYLIVGLTVALFALWRRHSQAERPARSIPIGQYA